MFLTIVDLSLENMRLSRYFSRIKRMEFIRYRLINSMILLSCVCFVAFGNRALEDTRELRRECSRALEKRDFKVVKEEAMRLHYISRLQRDDLGYAYSSFYLGTSEVFAGDAAKGVKYLQSALHLADSLGCDSLMGLTLNGLGIYEANVNNNYYLAQQYLLKSLRYPGIEGSVYSNLAQIARLQGDRSGMDYAQRCYDYGVEHNDSYYIYGGLLAKAEFCIFNAEYDTALDLIGKARKVAKERKKGDNVRLDFLEAVVLSHKNQTKQSTKLLIEMEDSIAKRAPIYLPELQFVIGKNFQKEKNYKESDRWLNLALESGDIHSSNDYTARINLELADNSIAEGEYLGAYGYLKRAYAAMEKTSRSELDRMNSERELAVELVEKEKEREVARAEARTRRLVNIFLSIFLIVAVGAGIYTIIILKRRNRLYHHIVKQNVKMLEDADQHKVRIKELEDLMAIKGGAESSLKERQDCRSKELFERLNVLMNEEEIFRNPLLTREDVIERLDTNSTYLTQAIKDNAEMNYSQYINSFRVAAALKSLSALNKTEIPIKTIAEEAGFNSLTTFYKVFQQAVGISPSAYRKSLKHL